MAARVCSHECHRQGGKGLKRGSFVIVSCCCFFFARESNSSLSILSLSHPIKTVYSWLVDSLSLPLRLDTKSSVGLLVTSETGMIGGVCINVQAGERGLHVGVSQVTHAHMQYEMSLSSRLPLDPITEELLSCGPTQLRYTNTHTQMHAHTFWHTANSHAISYMHEHTLTRKYMYALANTNKQNFCGPNVSHSDHRVWLQCGNYPARLTCANVCESVYKSSYS